MEAKSSTAESAHGAVVAAAPAPAVEEARAAGLRYSSDSRTGIRRLRHGDSFHYKHDDGHAIKDEETLGRIKSIVIPPAWEEVWICPYANGHIQATGRDVKGRKQYRYHPKWRSKRDETKFHHMLAFAKALPKIRRRVNRDLRLRKDPRQRMLATLVKLLEATLIRVGNDEYAKQNKSYGLTTMRKRHAEVSGKSISFAFRGKSGKHHEISVQDAQLARIVRRCQDLPGQELFSYRDGEGEVRRIGSEEVNAYLHEITGGDFTAKDFRTWAGTVLAATALKEFEEVASESQAKKNIVTAIEAVAKMLGNTPTVCRKCYVHPEVLTSYLVGTTIETISQRLTPKIPHISSLKSEEAAVFVLLQRRLKEQSKAAKRAHGKVKSGF